MKKSNLLGLSFGLGALLLTGCLFDGGGGVTARTWVGMPLDSLRNVAQVLASNGRLYVANRDSVDPGLAVVDTVTGNITAYHSELLPPVAMAMTADSNLIITETNYMQGGVSVLNTGTMVFQKSIISFASDNAVSVSGDKTFLFDRYQGVVTGFTGHTPGQNIVLNAQTGAGSNPYDITITNGKAYIPRYNLKSLLILDATQMTGGTRDSIDLSVYEKDTATHTPHMAWVTSYNGYVFVALQRLAVYTALDISLVVVINASTKAIVSTIPLHFKNPIAAHVVGTTWYLTGIANYGDQTGGVEKIDLAARTHAGDIVTESTLMADVFDFYPAGAHSGYVAYSTDFGFTTHVKKVSY